MGALRTSLFLAGMAAVGAVLAVAAVAVAEKPAPVVAGQEEALTLDGVFSPKALSKSTPTPGALQISGRVASATGILPPALRELTIETDRHGALNLEGLPTCVLGGRAIRRDADEIRKDCEGAIIGTGKAKFELAFPAPAPNAFGPAYPEEVRSDPLFVDGELTIFNGGGGPHSATLLALVDLTGPYPVPIVAEVKVTTIHKGRFGTEAVVSIPRVAGGRGTLVSFKARIFKKFAYKGGTKSVLTLTCADGEVLAHVHGVFEDGTESDTDIVRTCVPRAD